MPTLIAYPILTGDDYVFDVSDSSFSDNTSPVKIGRYSTCGIRFPNITIPPGETINSAFIRFTAGSDLALVSNLFLSRDTTGADAVAPTDFVGASGIVQGATTLWAVSDNWVTGTQYDSVDISADVQAIVNLGGWVSGNAMQFFIKRQGMGGGSDRYVKTLDGAAAAELHITYGAGATNITLDYSGTPFVLSGSMAGTLVADIYLDFGSYPFVLTGSSTFGLDLYNGLVQNLPLLTCVATGVRRSGSLSKILPILTCSATGQNSVIGKVRATLPLLRLSATGLTGVLGRMSADLPMLTISASGRTLAKGVGALLLPMLRIRAHGEEVVASFVALVMNPKNLAVSEYKGFSFNSFALFNGQYLAAGSGGIYVIGGANKDGNSNIDAELRTGQLGTGSAKPRDVYLAGKSDGQMLVTLSGDEDAPNNAKVDYLLEVLGMDRAKVPRGMNPYYLQIGIKNVSGSDFDLDSMEIYAEGLIRKKRP